MSIAVKFALISFIALVIQSNFSCESFCPLNFPAIGGHYKLQDFSNCYPIYETFTYTMEFCRDICLRWQPNCMSFNFGCGNQSLKLNCRLFDSTIYGLINMTLQSSCISGSTPKNCVHENFQKFENEEQKSC